ncbi:MAG: ferritin [Staphylococcus sp.]|nr:ferritin [Staphylococcus sp.]
MLNNKVQDALNAQINAEFWSAYLYLSMAQHFEAEGMPGVANWFKIQFKEEQDHATIFMNYINQRGGRVELKAIDAVPTTWATPLDAFKATLEHEQKVTSLINNLYALAEAEKDYATCDRLKWFVTEQVEEEDNCRTLIDKFALIGDNGMGLYMLNQELASRTYTTPSPLASEEA